MKKFFIFLVLVSIVFSGCAELVLDPLSDGEHYWHEISEGVWQKTKLDCTDPTYRCTDFCFENKEVEIQTGDDKQKTNVWNKCDWEKDAKYNITKMKNPQGTDVLCFNEGGFPMVNSCEIGYPN